MVAVTSVLLAGPAAAVTEEGSMMTGPPPADVTTFAPPAVTVTVFGGLVLRRAWVGPMAAGRMLPLGATIGGGGGLCCRLAGGCCKMAAMVGTWGSGTGKGCLAITEGTIGIGDGCCGREMACVEIGPGRDTLVIVVVVVVTLVGEVSAEESSGELLIIWAVLLSA